MPSPFPGMDPYLEAHWGDVHTSLVTYARDAIRPQLPGDLKARVEEHVAVEAENGGTGYYPDVRVVERPKFSATDASPLAGAAVATPVLVPMNIEQETERWVQIVDSRSGDRVVTTIEFLSPANKMTERGRNAYRKKQHEMIEAGVNLVEVDLLRSGDYVLAAPEVNVPSPCLRPYRVCVHRAWLPERAEMYRVSLREPVPAINVPLREFDADAVLDIQKLIDSAWENAGYEDVDYTVDPIPPLSADDAEWADRLLKEKGFR